MMPRQNNSKHSSGMVFWQPWHKFGGTSLDTRYISLVIRASVEFTTWPCLQRSLSKSNLARTHEWGVCGQQPTPSVLSYLEYSWQPGTFLGCSKPTQNFDSFHCHRLCPDGHVAAHQLQATQGKPVHWYLLWWLLHHALPNDAVIKTSPITEEVFVSNMQSFNYWCV